MEGMLRSLLSLCILPIMIIIIKCFIEIFFTLRGKGVTALIKCPLCGGPNGCAIEAGQVPHSCWCFRERVPQSLLEQIPPAQRNQSCVCQKCVLQAKADLQLD
ncbi:cysteine-rich CWC family protein [Paenibacillus sp. BIHB 4019]|uniref:cysteine-rich CWC family protein n=1 Tax=Paenibacillus sp. BIHB 4019 TaxID=1870819 RepID=UPI00329A1628